MITAIEVQNFGPFDSTTVLKLSPETFLIGPNNVGKSTFIAAYGTVALRSFNPEVTKFPSFLEASFGHRLDKQIALKVRADTPAGEAERGIVLDRHNNLSLTHSGNAEAVKHLEQILTSTWYLTSARVVVPHAQGLVGGEQPRLDHIGSNIIRFLLERWTARDPGWDEAERWLRKIDPGLVQLKSPLRGLEASLETSRKYPSGTGFDVNVAYQGGGVQRALQVLSALVFSPPGSVISIEEPEMNLHPAAQETLVDLFNHATNEWGKQIIVTSHSWNMVLPFISDIGPGSKRGADHIRADPSKFRLVTFSFEEGGIRLHDYDLTKEFKQIRDDFKMIWG